MWKKLIRTFRHGRVDPIFLGSYAPPPPEPFPWTTREELIFALAVVGLLVIVKFGQPAGVTYAAVGVLLQLLGGTLFAVGLLGDGVHRIGVWVGKYLSFTNFTVKPMSLFWPIVTSVGGLAVFHLSDRALAAVNFVAGGVGIALWVSVFAHYVRLPASLAWAHFTFLRLACVVVGIAMYWGGLRFMGG